jgi:hypothetical protein
VKVEGEKDKKYQKKLEALRMEMEKIDQTILHQEDGILFRK